MRRTAAFAVLFSVESQEVETDEGVRFRRLMAKIVEEFGDDCHWENFMARAVSEHSDRNYSGAVAMYRRARQSIESDELVRTQPCWQQMIRQIEAVEELARRQISLSSAFMSDYHGS